MSKAAETFESHFSLKPTRIHRFPHYLRGIGGADGRYMVPSRVAIGPYHRGWAHLQETEELKRVAAHSFLGSRAAQSRRSTIRSCPSPRTLGAATPPSTAYRSWRT